MEFKNLPKAVFAESVQSLEIFWSKVDQKPTWNALTKKFDGPLTAMVTLGLKGTGHFNLLEVEGVVFEDVGNYITLPSEGRSGSKLYEILKALVGEAKAKSFEGKHFTPDGEKKAAHLEGFGGLRGLKLAALIAHKKNGKARAKSFLPALPTPVNSFSRMEDPKPIKEPQTGFESMPDIKVAPIATGPITDDDDISF